MSHLRVGLIFGGRSVEHEVSVLTAHQAMAALPTDKYTPVPIYISKSGQWFTGDVLKHLENFKDLEKLVTMAEPVVFNVDATQSGLIHQKVQGQRNWLGRSTSEPSLEPIDVAFPLMHGSHGEDGTLQGLLEMADLPYVGSGVLASAIAMDKILAKRVLRSAGVPVIDDLYVSRARWESEPDAIVAEAESRFGYPVYVKPVTLGSSIGVSRAEDASALRLALDVAATYDSRLMIEPAQQDIIEINCSVLGDSTDARASVCEQPVSNGTLSYEDKYLSGDKNGGSKGRGMQSAKRLIPAPIDPDLTEDIQKAAINAFNSLNASGVVRIDFFVRPSEKKFYVNEINPITGSLSFYLWEPTGVDFPELVTTLVEIALKRHSEKRRSTFTFSSSLLSTNPLGGTKTAPR
jgi:D-alanine-D-alanine ligase